MPQNSRDFWGSGGAAGELQLANVDDAVEVLAGAAHVAAEGRRVDAVAGGRDLDGAAASFGWRPLGVQPRQDRDDELDLVCGVVDLVLLAVLALALCRPRPAAAARQLARLGQ